MIKVIFQQSPQERDDFTRGFFSERMDALPDLCAAMELTAIPMLAEGFRRMNEKDFEILSPRLAQAGPDDLLYFFCYLLQKLENPLCMNLFWEASLFMGFLFVKDSGASRIHYKETIRNRILEAIASRRARDWDRLHDALVNQQRDAMALILQWAGQYFQPAKAQKPFVWRIYRGRPQMCYSLAIRILHETYWGEYGGRRYLPSYEKMAKMYGVSVSTVRRAVYALNQTGAAESVNGAGVRIFSLDEGCRAPDFAAPSVRRNLAMYFQSFEILSYSCEAAALTAFQSLTNEQARDLAGQLEDDLRTGRSQLSLWRLLIFIARNSPLRGVREIYSKAYGLFLWGYPLKASVPQTQRLDQLSLRFTEAMSRSFALGDYAQCARRLKEHFSNLFPLMKEHLLRQGLTLDDLRFSPTIRLMLF